MRRRRSEQVTIGHGAEPPEPYEAGELTDTEYRMLLALSVNAGRVLSHTELLQRVGGISWTRRLRLLREGLRVDCRCNVIGAFSIFSPLVPFAPGR